MSEKENGSGLNGSQADNKKQGKVVHFPGKTERQKRERTIKAKIIKPSSTQKNHPPFLNLENITPFARFITVAMLAVHIPLSLFIDQTTRFEIFYKFGFVAANLTHIGHSFSWSVPLSLITHIFIHGSWMHLMFNGVMALALSIMFERVYGTRRTAIFFFACGIIGALFYLALNPYSTVPLIGASGCISGLFAATIMMLHSTGQMGQLGSLGQRGPWPILGIWLAIILITGFLSGENTAWQAHLGGFLAGAGLYHLLRTGKIRF